MSDENQKETVVDSKATEELSPEELNKVNGGDSTIISPRDAAQGLPTGKRMYKPYTITE